jgi:hypothetical protein
MLVYRFNVLFEDEEDVLRVIEIKANQTFLDLHQAIQKAIGFDGSKPASFYMSSDHWRKGKEISLEGRNETPRMEKAVLNTYIIDPHQKIVYISDYEEEWTLRVSLTRILQAEEGKTYPFMLKSTGEAPKQYKLLRPLADPESEFDALVKNMLGGKTPIEYKKDRIADEGDDESEKPVKKKTAPAKTTPAKPAAPAKKDLEIEDAEEAYDAEDYESYTSIDGDDDTSSGGYDNDASGDEEDDDYGGDDNDYGFDDYGSGGYSDNDDY